MRTVLVDIETPLIEEGKLPSEIYCIVTQEVEVDDEPRVWLPWDYPAFKEYAHGVEVWVGHNALPFDVPVLNNVLDLGIPLVNVLDTFVVSRLVAYSRYRTHSLAELGAALGQRKTVFNDFSHLSLDMVNYCVDDVKTLMAVYKHYLPFASNPEWDLSIRLEHDMVITNEEMKTNGFLFDKEKAEEYLADITTRMAAIEKEFQQLWPPALVEVNRIQYRFKLDGSLMATVTNAIGNYPKTEIDGEELVCYDYRSFNPGSSKDRVEKLWGAGWKPYVKTKTHMKFDRAQVGEMWGKSILTAELHAEKKEHFATYGWTVSEENLLTLPDDAPEGASKLAEWLCLEGRRSSLTEWIGCVREDGRIHGKFWHIGAWTHRMSHSSPNQANIFSPFHGTPRNAVERIKEEFDYNLRALWCTDKVLVGTDADGIQLRILCHYMKSEAYREAILTGRKEDETDIHNLNKQALGTVCMSRDDAKTFIYAWLLGASNGKVATILKCTTRLAGQAVQQFLESLPELKRVKNLIIPRDASRGYFVGLDGRKVLCDSEHLMLAGYLQNGEAIAMKMWIREWKRLADEAGLWYKLVDFVHDEVQVEVNTTEDAKTLIELQQQAMLTVSEQLDLFCPLEVTGDIGYSWAETH